MEYPCSFTITGGVNFTSSAGASGAAGGAGGVGGGGGGAGNSATAGGGGGGGALVSFVLCAERYPEMEHTVSNNIVLFILISLG